MKESSSKNYPPKALAVLTAARNVFFAHGYSAATTDMIQKEAGVSKSTLYQYFKSKEGMLRAVIEWSCSQNVASVSFSSIEGSTCREKLFSAALSYLEIIRRKENVSLFRIVVEVAPSFPGLGEVFFNSGPEAFKKGVAAIIRESAPNEGIQISEEELESASTLFCSMVRGEPLLLSVVLPEKELKRKELEEWARLSVEKFWKACFE